MESHSQTPRHGIRSRPKVAKHHHHVVEKNTSPSPAMYDEDHYHQVDDDDDDFIQNNINNNENLGREKQRPRRPRPETIAYLRSLPLEVSLATRDIHAFLAATNNPPSNTTATATNESASPDYPSLFHAALTALDEIQHEIASLAGDEHGSVVLESIAHITCPYSPLAARFLLHACVPYTLHLTTHRYGSHVLQTILQLALLETPGESGDSPMDLARHPDSPWYSAATGDGTETSRHQSVPSLVDLLLSIHAALVPYTADLAVHVCGSHVLRTLICALGGVHVQAPSTSSPASFPQGSSQSTQLSNPKKKKKKRKAPGGSDDGLLPAFMFRSNSNLNHRRGQPVVTMFPLQRLFEVRSDTTTPQQQQQHQAMQQALSELVTQLDAKASVDGVPLPKSTRHNSNDAARESTIPAVSFFGPLQTLACHPSAGPLISVLLRVLTYSERDVTGTANAPRVATTSASVDTTADRHLGKCNEEPRFQRRGSADRLVQRLLRWSTASATTNHDDPDNAPPHSSSPSLQPYVGSVVYELAGDRIGSRVLETILHVSPPDVFAAIVTLGEFTKPSALRQYTEHAVANFVVQTVLATLPPSRAGSNASAADETNPTSLSDLPELLTKALLPCIANGYLLDPCNHRRSVLWRFTEMTANHPELNQDRVIDALRQGCTLLLQHQPKRAKSTSASSSSSLVNLSEVVPFLLFAPSLDEVDATQPTPTSPRFDVEGMRTLHHFFRFDVRHVKPILRGLWAHCDAARLEMIIRDGLASRCVVDGLLGFVSRSALSRRRGRDRETTTSSHESTDAVLVGQKALRQLRRHLAGRWVSLATDRVGHHTVRQLFELLIDKEATANDPPDATADDRELLVQELAEGVTRLLGNAMGRSILDVCAVRDYQTRGRTEWQRLVRQQQNTKQQRRLNSLPFL